LRQTGLLAVEHFFKVPNMIAQTGFHRWRNAQRGMYAAEVVVEEKQRDHVPVVGCFEICRVHQTLPVTPAMESGLADHIWSLEELLRPLNQRTVGAAP
jgi:hypothetical protein